MLTTFGSLSGHQPIMFAELMARGFGYCYSIWIFCLKMESNKQLWFLGLFFMAPYNGILLISLVGFDHNQACLSGGYIFFLLEQENLWSKSSLIM